MSGMPNRKREFEYVPQRQGGSNFRALFSLTCCDCGTQETIESRSPLPDVVVRKKFSQRGWQVGRGHHRDADHCPTCLGVKPENVLANKFKVITRDGPVEPAEDIVKRGRETMDQKVTNALKLMRSQTTTPSSPPPQQVTQQPMGLVLDLSPIQNLLSRISSQLEEIRSELQDVRAANELSMETQSRLIEKVNSLEPLALPAPPVGVETTPGSAPVDLGMLGSYKLYPKTKTGYLRLDKGFFRSRIKSAKVLVHMASDDVIEYRTDHGLDLKPGWKRNAISQTTRSCAVQTGHRFHEYSGLLVEIVEDGFNLRRT